MVSFKSHIPMLSHALSLHLYRRLINVGIKCFRNRMHLLDLWSYESHSTSASRVGQEFNLFCIRSSNLEIRICIYVHSHTEFIIFFLLLSASLPLLASQPLSHLFFIFLKMLFVFLFLFYYFF